MTGTDGGLAGRHALVTGSSSGLGVDFARELARRGAGLTLVARREDRLRAVARELADTHGVEVQVLVLDLNEADAPTGCWPTPRLAGGPSTCWSTTPASGSTAASASWTGARAGHAGAGHDRARAPDQAVPARHAGAAQRLGPQHRLDRRLPAIAAVRQLLGRQELHPQLHRGARLRAAGRRGAGHGAVARDRGHRLPQGLGPAGHPLPADGHDGQPHRGPPGHRRHAQGPPQPGPGPAERGQRLDQPAAPPAGCRPPWPTA